MQQHLLVIGALALLCCLSGANAALTFHLNSGDFPPADGKTSLKDYVAATSSQGECVLVGLDNGLGGVVRFTYSSNVTDLRLRSDVLVSMHAPSPSAPSMAITDDATAVMKTKLFTAADLHRVNVEAGVVRRGKERQGTTEQTDEEERVRSLTVALRPSQVGTGTASHSMDGNYAACFRLFRTPSPASKNAPVVYEEVRIQLLEVASTSRSTSTYIARLNNPVANAVGDGKVPFNVNSEADREYAKMIRMMFRANKNADLQKLLDTHDAVTSEEMQEQLDALKAVQKQLFAMYSTSEHLEERFARMRKTAETTFTRIWICMLATVLVMCATIWFTFHFTKDIIVKRKLI